MGLDEDWCAEYRDRRDYGHLSEKQLCDRYASLLENAIQFHESGVAFISGDLGPPWSKRLCWTKQELRRRSMEGKADELEQAELARSRPRVNAARDLWARTAPFEEGSHLIKFGKRQHVQDMLDRGRFRIAPASLYNDSSLNSALQDDELLAERLSPNGARLLVKIDGTFQEISGIDGPLRFTRRCENYYVFCASGAFDPRLFDAFEADACLVVRNIDEFRTRMNRGVANVSGMTKFAFGLVRYIDPLDPFDPSETHHLVEMTKDFRFKYQVEWRMAWKGEQPLPVNAAPIFVQIGPLTGCCEAYYLGR